MNTSSHQDLTLIRKWSRKIWNEAKSLVNQDKEKEHHKRFELYEFVKGKLTLDLLKVSENKIITQAY